MEKKDAVETGNPFKDFILYNELQIKLLELKLFNIEIFSMV